MTGAAFGAAFAALLPYSSFSTENAVLTVALALPGVAAVVVDRLLRRAPRAAAGPGVGRRRRAR